MSEPSIFEALAALIRPYAAELSVKSDTDTNLYLEESRTTGKPQMFAAVQAKKSYVSFHLFPVYQHPELLDGVSPALRRRMQGKSCFNFTRVDQIPSQELAEVVRRAYQIIMS
jgi:hypothetical protein